MNYTHECSLLLSTVMMTMMVFMVSTFMIIASYVSKRQEFQQELQDEKQDELQDEKQDDQMVEMSSDDTNYDTDTESCEEREVRVGTSYGTSYGTRRRTNRYRDMDLLSHGQKIRYVYEGRECLGMYNSKSRMFVNEQGKSFGTPSSFASNHLLEMKMNGKMRSVRKTFQVNGWTDCECEVNGLWISLDDYVNNVKSFMF